MNKYLLSFALLILLVNFYGCKKPVGKLSGVVIFKSNEKDGEKPDVGSNVYVLPRFVNDSAELKLLIDYFTYRETISNIKILNSQMGMEVIKSTMPALYEWDKKEVEKSWSILKEKGISNENELNEFEENVLSLVEGFHNRDGCKYIVADGNGTYSTTLPVNDYFVLIISAHNTGNTIVEEKHSCNFSLVLINADEETIYNSKF